MPDKIIQQALEHFRHSESGSAHIREWALEDIDFGRLGNQWPSQVREQRRLDNRPCLTVNRMPGFTRQVVNDGRQNKPSIGVIPVDNGADVEAAEIIGGLIRSIERGSNAQIAYDTALDQAVSSGFGFFRITTDYCHDESFDQEARIERVANQFSVHWDVDSTKFDASDWRYAFVSDLLTPAEFKRRYPKEDPSSWQDGLGEDWQYWAGQDEIRIAEYFTRDEKTRKIVRFTDGSVFREDALKRPVMLPMGMTLPLIEALAMQGIVPNAERDSTYYEVTRRVISGAAVLEEAKWPGSMIPICPVWGEEVIYRGKRYFRSIIRDARDPQQMLNYWRSSATELVALAPRAPWLVPLGAIPPEAEAAWKTANTRNHAYLEYDANAGAMPQRQPFAGIPGGALQEALNAADDIKSVIGIYDAALGARSNETSGRAILARQRESNVATFHFLDNLARAIEYGGRVLIDVIPSLYSTRQTIRILGENNEAKIVRVQAEHGTPPTQESPDGKIYNLSTGKYDVAVTVGPNYETQRQETQQNLTALVQAYPQAAPVLGDLLVENMDWPGAQQAADRIRVMQYLEGMRGGVPQEILADMFPEIAQKFARAQAQQAQQQMMGGPMPTQGGMQPQPMQQPTPQMPMQGAAPMPGGY